MLCYSKSCSISYIIEKSFSYILYKCFVFEGSTLTLVVKVTDLSSSDSLVYGILLDETGTEITRMRLAQSPQGRKRKGIAVFNVPNKV